MLLGEILVRSGYLTQTQVDEALRAQAAEPTRRRLGAVLRDAEVISEEQLLQALGEQFGLKVLTHVPDECLDPDLIARLPLEWARNHMMLPIRLNGTLGVLTCDPTQVAEQDDLALLLEAEAVPVLLAREEIERAIERCYFNKQDTARDFIRDLDMTAAVDAPKRNDQDLLQNAQDAPTTQLVNLILLEAVKAGASDIHIEPFQDRLAVRYRMDGYLYEQSSPPKHLEASLTSRIKVMGDLDIAERRLPQDGMARVRVGGRELDIRISTMPVAAGERIVLRILNRESTLLSLAELGLSDHLAKPLRKLLREPVGVIWVTGPTGSGKTTTLYAALQELDTRRRNVLTIEDPVEYQLPGIGQMAVKPKIGLTFARGLRHILRQDPDIILVGETRDAETAEIVARASLTGHLVFSTLHTNDAASAIIRLIDMGIEPYLVMASTRASLAQRLVRALCPACKQGRMIANEEIQRIGPAAEMLAGGTVWDAQGCDACLEGYKGRIGIYELLVMDEEIRDVIRTGGGLTKIRAAAAKQGMRTMLEEGLEKVAEGITSLEEVLRVAGREQESI